MREKIKENQTLTELIIGILFFGIVCQVIGAVIVGIYGFCSQTEYALSLWIGIAAAVIMAIHMNHTIGKALDQDEKTAAKITQSSYFLRFGCVMVLLGVVAVSEIANPLIVFLGIMGLKIGAYIQPFTHKIFFPGQVREEDGESSADTELSDVLKQE